MIIQNGRILAAGCFLPLSEQQAIKKNFGTRHRAALGMSEYSDAVTLVVSEETGAISLAYESRLHYDLSTLEVSRRLRELLDKGARKGTADSALPELSAIAGAEQVITGTGSNFNSASDVSGDTDTRKGAFIEP
jgi:diadenylate cyclase